MLAPGPAACLPPHGQAEAGASPAPEAAIVADGPDGPEEAAPETMISLEDWTAARGMTAEDGPGASRPGEPVVSEAPTVEMASRDAARARFARGAKPGGATDAPPEP